MHPAWLAACGLGAFAALYVTTIWIRWRTGTRNRIEAVQNRATQGLALTGKAGSPRIMGFVRPFVPVSLLSLFVLHASQQPGRLVVRLLAAWAAFFVLVKFATFDSWTKTAMTLGILQVALLVFDGLRWRWHQAQPGSAS